MFSSKYLTIVAKIRDVVVTRGDQAVIGDEEGGCARITISPLFPNLLYTVCRSWSIASPLRLPDIFLKLCSSLDNAGGRSFSGGGGTSAVKDGIDLNTLRPLLHIQDCSSGILLSSRVSLWLKNYFSSCVRRGGHSWWSGGHRRWRRWLCKDHNKLFIS